MNYRYVFNQFALLMLVLSAVLVLMSLIFFGWTLVGGVDVDADARLAFIMSGTIGLLIGAVLWFTTRGAVKQLGRRDALMLVGVTWLIGAAFCAMPYLLWAQLHDAVSPEHPFRSVIDCYFESMSGLTTTGATVLGGDHPIEEVPRSLLLWRALTQWLGGIGIVVLFVAVLPSLGVGGKRVYKVEAPGPRKEGVQPNIRDTARVLWLIYLGMTAAQVVALMIAGMTLYDAVCHAFTSLATGGFSTRDASIGYYDSVAIDIICIVFMLLAGVNFALLYQLLRRRLRSVLGDPEFRLYLLLFVIGTGIVAVSVMLGERPIEMTTGTPTVPTTAHAIEQSAFTVASIQSTTGYATSNFDRFPFFAQAMLVVLMFIGGSAGSTAGGIKVVRVWVALKIMWAEIERVFRPNVVRPIKIGRSAIDQELRISVLAYVLGIIALWGLGTMLVMLFEQVTSDGSCTFTTAATATVASLCTIGPGLDQVGAIENYGWLSAGTKIVLSLWMALGRLEIFALLVLVTPRFWGGD